MNLNEKIKGLGQVVCCDVEEDVYSGKNERYITFTYDDERPELAGDNKVVWDTAFVQVSYFVPKNYSYMTDKHNIRDFLEKEGFKVTSIRAWVEDARTGYQNIRHVLFETTYTEKRKGE